MSIRTVIHLSTFAMVLALAGGCDGAPQASDGGPPGDGAPDVGPTDGAVSFVAAGASFQSCLRPGTGLLGASCALVEVPLDWRAPDGPEVELFVKHIAARNAPSRGQVWLLGGLWGTSGLSVEEGANLVAAVRPDLDILIVDRRGFGRSTRLACPLRPTPPYWQARLEAEDYAAADEACFDDLEERWGDGLAHFDTANAARDLGHLVDAFHREGELLFFVAVGDAGEWVLRYLADGMTTPTGTFLDTPCGPGQCGGLDLAGHTDAVTRRWLDRCAADEACRARLSDDPVAFIGDLFARIEGGHCPELSGGVWPLERFRFAIAALAGLTYDNFLQAPPAIHRYSRCAPEDIVALEFWWDQWARWIKVDNEPLAEHAAAILHRAGGGVAPLPSLGAIEERGAALTFDDHAASYRARLLWGAPHFAAEPPALPLPTTPVWVVSGDHDPLAGEGRGAALADALGPAARFISIAGGYSPVAATSGCGSSLAAAFLADPAVPPNMSCAMTDTRTPPFRNTPADARRWFGTEDVWD